MSAIDPTYLFAIGVLFIAAEIVVYSFFLIWMGIGFMFAAALSLLYPFQSGITQTAMALGLGVILVVLLRKKTAMLALASSHTAEERAHISGVGTVEKGRIKFDGTYWKCDDDLSNYSEHERVTIIIENNRAKIV